MMQQIYLGLGGAAGGLSLTVASTTTNLDLQTLFNNAQSGVWADSQDKTLTIGHPKVGKSCRSINTIILI